MQSLEWKTQLSCCINKFRADFTSLQIMLYILAIIEETDLAITPSPLTGRATDNTKKIDSLPRVAIDV